jgi:hypothetical protein
MAEQERTRYPLPRRQGRSLLGLRLSLLSTFSAPLLYSPEANRGDRRFTFPNESVSSVLLAHAIAHTEQFTAAEFFSLAEKTKL